MCNTKISEKPQKDFVFILLFGIKGVMIYFCAAYNVMLELYAWAILLFNTHIEHGPNISINQGYYVEPQKYTTQIRKYFISYIYWFDYMWIHISVSCSEVFNLKLRTSDKKY